MTCGFLVGPGKCNRSPDAWAGLSWLRKSDSRLFATSLTCAWTPGKCNGHPMPGLDSPGLGHRIASFSSAEITCELFWCRTAAVAKALFLPLELTLMTRLRTSRRRQWNDGFFSPYPEQAEPMRQRLEMCCGGKTQEQCQTEPSSHSISHA